MSTMHCVPSQVIPWEHSQKASSNQASYAKEQKSKMFLGKWKSRKARAKGFVLHEQMDGEKSFASQMKIPAYTLDASCVSACHWVCLLAVSLTMLVAVPATKPWEIPVGKDPIGRHIQTAAQSRDNS